MPEPKPYSCVEHGFVTMDRRAAAKHIKGDIIDDVFNLAAKIVKSHLGVQPSWCRCHAVPFPHTHAPVSYAKPSLY